MAALRAVPTSSTLPATSSTLPAYSPCLPAIRVQSKTQLFTPLHIAAAHARQNMLMIWLLLAGPELPVEALAKTLALGGLEGNLDAAAEDGEAAAQSEGGGGGGRGGGGSGERTGTP